MMLGERSYSGTTTVHVPPWTSAADDPASFCLSPNNASVIDDYSVFFQTDSLTALQRYLPSNESDNGSVNGGVGDFLTVDAHSCDHFRMFEFKVRKCTRGRSHDWTECPFAHPGEKARRRDPRKYHYSGTACPDFRKGHCFKGDACEHAHGVFECWLHPARYRTQPCKDGMGCKRRVCFFAHSPDQLRVLSPRGAAAAAAYASPPESPPMSPLTPSPVNEMVASLRNLRLSKVNSMPSSWANLSPNGGYLSLSLPNTPTRPVARPGIGYYDAWGEEEEEEGPREMVESGRDLRAKMFEKLSKENPLDRVDPGENPNPDVGWVSDLLK